MPRVEQLYADHEALIHKRAWSWVRTTGREFDDLLGVCHDAFMECVVYWQRGKGSKFSSVLATVCNHRIQDHLRKNDRPIDTGMMPDVSSNRTWSEITTKDMITSLSDEAKQVVYLLLNCPEELTKSLQGNNPEPRHIKGALNRLCKLKGISEAVMQRVTAEIRSALREY